MLKRSVKTRLKNSGNKEKWFVLFLVLFWLAFLIPCTIIAIMIFVQDCNSCNPWEYKAQRKLNICMKEQWGAIVYGYKTLVYVSSFSCLVLIIFKIFSGITVLYKMKRNLHGYYVVKYKEIIFTMVLTSLITAWKWCYFYFDFLREHDLKYNFMLRDSLSYKEAPIQIFVYFTDMLLPIIAMAVNINTVDFKKYLLNLMRGCNVGQFFLSGSIFIRLRPMASNESLISHSSAIVNEQDSEGKFAHSWLTSFLI